MTYMLLKWKIDYPSPDGPDVRRAYVYLPKSYDKNPDKHYPVLYMFDGHNVFYDSHATYGKSWGMKKYMDCSKRDLIIASIECNSLTKNGRLREYSPYDFSDRTFGDIDGHADETMSWFLEVFKPYVDENFRTIPDRNHTYIAGSSMGGLMSLYALLAYNDYFCGAAALSPSLWTNPEEIEKLIKSVKLHRNTKLYIDYGSNELKNHRGMQRIFQKATSLLMKKKIFITSRIVPYGDHCEACWEKQIPIFLDTILYNGYK